MEISKYIQRSLNSQVTPLLSLKCDERTARRKESRAHSLSLSLSLSLSRSPVLTLSLPLDLHTAAVHLDDLGSEGLDGSQDQLLVLKGSDAKTQYISVEKRSKRNIGNDVIGEGLHEHKDKYASVLCSKVFLNNIKHHQQKTNEDSSTFTLLLPCVLYCAP